ncbi:MAG: hypothetical protein AABX14_02665 [Candidatus Aenigmatarchaeota archaeon]
MEDADLEKLKVYVDGLEGHAKRVAAHYYELNMANRTPRRQDDELDITTCERVVRDLREMFPYLQR